MSNRTIATVALAICLSVTVLMWAPGTGTGQASSVVDLTATTNAVNCNPCHARIGTAPLRGLIFSHGNHLLVECDACHIGPAHENGTTTRPVMDTCFACHGLRHGAQGMLAAGACTDCHTKAWVLRPKSHVKDWAGKPHAAYAAKTGVNRCMMCHEAAKDCDPCHRQKAPKVGPMPSVYMRNIPVQPTLPAVMLDTKAAPSMATCVFCHPDVGAVSNPRLIFDHTPHTQRDYKCAACHTTFPHTPSRTIRPPMDTCYQCHSLTHGPWGEVATEKCADCHPKSFNLVPVDHTVAFRIGGHKTTAKADTKRCTMCHASAFCVPCHNGKQRMVNGNMSPVVIPVDHRSPDWQPNHGKLYLSQQGACSICHTSASCTQCHSTTMPHPPQWITLHAQKGYPTADCNVCHTDREQCQECHHGGVKSHELLKANCVGCHPEMNTEPPTKIKNIGLAEHAVHFNVQKRVGRPYVCEDCHIGFTVARVLQPASPTQAHDMRLCYDCHGMLDTNDRLIAPYPGSELCRRCHANLNL